MQEQDQQDLSAGFNASSSVAATEQGKAATADGGQSTVKDGSANASGQGNVDAGGNNAGAGGADGNADGKAGKEQDATYWRNRFQTVDGMMKKQQGEARAALEQAEREKKELAERLASSTKTDSNKDGDPGAGGNGDDDPVELLRREAPTVTAGVEALVQRSVAAALKPMQDSVKPVIDRAEKSAAEAHFKAIHDAHKDWETVIHSAEFDRYVNSLPSWAQGPAKQVLEAGTAQEVVELIGGFKGTRSNGHDRQDEDDAALVRSRGGSPSGSGGGSPSRDDLGAGFALSANQT